MIMRGVNALTDLFWRFVSWRMKVPVVIGERIRLFVKVTPEMTEGERWREHYKAAYELLGILNEKAEALLVYSGLTLAVLGVANIHQKAEEVTVLHGLISERGYFDRHRNRHSGLDLLQSDRCRHLLVVSPLRHSGGETASSMTPSGTTCLMRWCCTRTVIR